MMEMIGVESDPNCGKAHAASLHWLIEGYSIVDDMRRLDRCWQQGWIDLDGLGGVDCLNLVAYLLLLSYSRVLHLRG